MQYMLIAIVLVVLCAVGFSSRQNTSNETPARIEPQDPVTVSSEQYLSRQDIQKQLAVIAKAPPPKELAMGAMCYDMAGPPARIDYVCPNCSEKTLYALNPEADEESRLQYWTTAQNLRSLESCRRLVQQINTLDVTLNESRFCTKCAQDVEEARLGLIIQYPNQPQPHHVSEINETDLLLIKAVTEGKLKYKDLQDNEIPIKNHLPRLEELLGTEIVLAADQYMTFREVKDQLAVIARKPIPKTAIIKRTPRPTNRIPRGPGAMCYAVGPGGLRRSDYICPDCGEKTLYAIEDSASDRAIDQHLENLSNLRDMDACRRLAHTIYTLDITLDESQFCSHCADDHDAPELGLIICYADRPKTHQIEGISLTDLIMIKAVIDGRLTYQEHEGTEYALRRETLRLKQLLGLRI
ncbi:MAG: hypothetical protein ACYSTR_09635 [Planctomycetota bacterium]|jgi:predicted RNA-binding Zn-ribbon protein involved in translation (DUF1610 family)